ncbi:MAG: hypothetical protein AB1508_16335 [Pseudomonadota bacterium]
MRYLSALSGGFAMLDRLIGWWCFLIGVTDRGAIHVAEGIIAAVLLLLIPVILFGLLRYRR